MAEEISKRHRSNQNQNATITTHLPRILVLLLLVSSISPSAAFVARRDRRHNHNSISCSAKISRLSLAASASSVDPASRFHTDMLRVLQSRESLASNSPLQNSPLERRKRPALLTSDIDGAERVASMLQHMVVIGVASEESYQIVLKALANRGRLRWRRTDSTIVCAADEVGPLIDQLWDLDNGPIATETFNLALQAYATCATPRGNRQYAQQAQGLLNDMESAGVPITEESLSHTTHAWAWQQENRQSGECAKMAQENVDRLLELSPDTEIVLQTYHWVLESWSKSSSPGSPETASKILNKMISLKKSAPDSEFPNAQSYSHAILAWAKNKEEQSAEKAQLLLVETLKSYENGEFPEGVEPELIAFNGVLSAWARIGRADKAEEVLWMAAELRSKCQELVPDVVSYNSVLHAYVRSKDKSKALDRILSIVKRMEESASAQPKIKPDSFTYNTVLKAWVQSKRPDAALQAEKTLQQMRDLWDKGDRAAEPSNRHYNIVINAMAKSSDRLDARKAYELLLQMQASSNCKPDIISYTSVIECFSKSSDPDAAGISMELLQQAQDVYEATRDPEMMPNLRTYTMAIVALSTYPVIANVLKARELLIQLGELYKETKDVKLQPNAYPYNYVLNCAANCVGTTKEKVQAFQVAAQTYNDMRKSKKVKPDSYTYAFWFKCCNNLLPEGDLRTKGVKLAFEQCKSDGLVSLETLRRLLAGTPPNVVCDLFDSVEPNTSPTIYRKLTINDLPPAWSRNVR